VNRLLILYRVLLVETPPEDTRDRLEIRLTKTPPQSSSSPTSSLSTPLSTITACLQRQQFANGFSEASLTNASDVTSLLSKSLIEKHFPDRLLERTFEDLTTLGKTILRCLCHHLVYGEELNARNESDSSSLSAIDNIESIFRAIDSESPSASGLFSSFHLLFCSDTLTHQ